MPDASGHDGCDELLIQVGGMIIYLFSSVALGLAGLLIYIYYARNGQFDDLEDTKYQMFRDEEQDDAKIP